MKVVLAEKPSVAREIAAFLGAKARHEGYFEGQGYQVTWALGHLVTLKEPHDYDPALKRWSLESLPIVPERFGLKPLDTKSARAQLAIIGRLFRSADEIIGATDAGREGELIFRYILEQTGRAHAPARRLWLSSLTPAAIREAFTRLRPLADYDNLYAAARCRSEADWVVGLNATRYYTVRHRDGGVLWSVGRVQTPVLALIARRDDEIRAFRPEPFWELLTHYREVLFKFAGDRFKKEEEAQDVLRRVQGHPFVVRDIERKPERVPPPQLFDLTELQREMNRRFGLSADATLKAAQALYEKQLISYPRTDSRYLSSDLKPKIPGILRELKALKPAEIDALDLSALAFSGRIVNDSKISDHHAIIPTGKKPPGTLAGAESKVFDAVVLRLIAAFYPTCVKEVTVINGLSNAVPFRARGVRVVEPGWTVLYPRKPDENSSEDEQVLPAFRPGESGPHEPFVRRGQTVPPRPYTEATLLGAMETAGKLVEDETLREALKEHGLGTPATRAAIIETLLERGYITRDRKTLNATDLGRYLVVLVRDRGLKSPELTGEWEAKLREIERGRLDPRRFLDEIVRFTSAIVHSDETTSIDPTRWGECPRCGRPVIAGKRDLGCSGWREGCPFILRREYQGHMLSDEQLRELLQHGALVRPVRIEGSGEVILQLSASGIIMAIPLPASRPRPFAGKPKGRRERAVSGSEPSPRRTRAATPGRRRRREADSGTTPAPRAMAGPESSVVAGFANVALGACPLCGRDVVEQAKSYSCGGWKDGCRFAIWKTIAGKRITVRTAQALLRHGRTDRLKGFKSKTGNAFEARLKLDGGEVRLDFDP